MSSTHFSTDFIYHSKTDNQFFSARVLFPSGIIDKWMGYVISKYENNLNYNKLDNT